MNRSRFFLQAACGMLVALPAAAAPDWLPAPLPGAQTIAQEREAGALYPLVVAPIEQPGGITANLAATRTLDGELSRRIRRAPAQGGAEAVFQGYKKALAEAGFELLFVCTGAQCGAHFPAAAPAVFAGAGEHRYLAARRESGAHDLYVVVDTATVDGRVLTQVESLRVQPIEVAAITIDAEAMAKQLEASGRVALYGLYFATDSAEIKPASEPTLHEIARLLRMRPELRLLVVGHTDTRGSFDYNIDLSKRRAQAVVDALVTGYGVSGERLKPWGVGFTVPAATNDTRAGRTRNRRVELVTW